MHRKRTLGLVLFAALLSAVLAVSLLLRATLGVSTTSHVNTPHEGSPTSTAQGEATRASATTTVKPTAPAQTANGSLVIPAIGVNAPIELVGIDTKDNTLAVPQINPWTGVGLYKYGPTPGAQGSSVIDGHLDRPGGYPAVFWNLWRLKAGDIVTVINAQGIAYHFKVTATATYAPSAAPLSSIFHKSGGAYLNLITCSGKWIPALSQTTTRLVVYTTLV